MKKILKYLKFLILLIMINQIVILIFNDSIRKDFWKSNSKMRYNEHDVLELRSNLKLNIITENNGKMGIVQLYLGKKLLISNLKLSEWYLYENKGSK